MSLLIPRENLHVVEDIVGSSAAGLGRGAGIGGRREMQLLEERSRDVRGGGTGGCCEVDGRRGGFCGEEDGRDVRIECEGFAPPIHGFSIVVFGF